MDNFNLLSDRLAWCIYEKQIRENRRVYGAELASVAGVSRAAVTKWMKDDNGINAVQARLLAEFFNVNAEWLETGNGKKEVSKLQHQQDEFTIREYVDVSGAMGSGLLLRDQPGQITGFKVNAEWMNKNIPANSGKDNLAVVTGFGDSMKGMFNSGDPLLVDTGVKSLEFDGVYFFRVGNEGFIKRLQRIPGDGIRVISKNTEYESWTITEGMDFEIFGRVLKVWKSEDF